MALQAADCIPSPQAISEVSAASNLDDEVTHHPVGDGAERTGKKAWMPYAPDHVPGLWTLETMAMHIQHSGGVAQHKVGGLAKSMGEGAWKVISMPLDQCGSPFQRLGVLTNRRLLQRFKKYKKLHVLGSAAVTFPGVERDPAIVIILSLPPEEIVGKRGKNKSGAEQVTDLLKEANLLQSGQSGLSDCHRSDWHRSWPLQDTQFNLAMSIQASGRFTRNWSDFAVKFFKWREDDVWSRAVAKHFGFPVAAYFTWQSSYIRCLWGLAGFGLIFTVLEGSLSEDEYDMARPVFCIPLLLFGAAVSEFEDPEDRIITLARESGIEPEAEEGASSGDGSIEEADRPQFIHDRPAWKRWARTCMLGPCMLVQFSVIAFVFVCVFWFEMWVIFEWGQCRRINDEHREEYGEHSGFPCRSSEQYRGYWAAFVLESLPSITEGILFEVLIGISKSMATLVCDQQNWRTERQYQFAFVVQVFLIEMIGKVGFICVLAFSFTPNWGLYGDCEDALDSAIFGSSSLSCIKAGVPYELRKAMLRRAMRGPMLVSMLVAIAIKVLVPKLVTNMVWAARHRSTEEKRRHWCSSCMSCGRGLLRLLGLIFIYDCDAVGGLHFVKNKMMYLDDGDDEPDTDTEEATDETAVASDTSVAAAHCSDVIPMALPDSDAACECDAGAVSPAQPPLPRIVVQSALYEGLRKEFTVADEYLEVLLHFAYFSFLGLVWPMGCLFALINFLLEYRFDVAKLGQVRRRPVPKEDKNLRKLLKTFAIIVSMVAIPFNVLIMLLPFEVLVIWFPAHFTEMVSDEGHEVGNFTFHEYRQSMSLADYVPYWLFTFFAATLVLFACSCCLRLGLREVRKRDLKATMLSLRRVYPK